MPPITDFVIPVLSRSPDPPSTAAARVVSKQESRARTYTDEPLPVRLSDYAPRQATIVGRVIEPDKVAYILDIAGVTMSDVGIDEVLDYVSPYDLEIFETKQFEEEIEVDKVAELAAEAEAERRRQRQKARAQRKGVIIYQDLDEDPPETDDTVEVGRGGRPRPTYNQFYKPVKIRQRRKRDPATGELMPLSGEEAENVAGPEDSSDGEPAAMFRPANNVKDQSEMPKRRRRKRDPVTGELLPLTSLPQATAPIQSKPYYELVSDIPYKRPRRRRHPITSELMPLGWRYDPDAPGERIRSGAVTGFADVDSMRRLSIGREPEAKRPRLVSESSSSDMKAQSASPIRSFLQNAKHPVAGSPMPMRGLVDVDKAPEQLQRASASKSKPKPKLRGSGRTSMTQPTHQSAGPSAMAPSLSDSSPEPITLASFLRPSKKAHDTSSDDDSSLANSRANMQMIPSRGKTSIMKPMGSQTAADADEEAPDADLEEDEFIVEAILGHHMSDPRTHPGKESTMLYKVKWQGFDEPTWEPADSFDDPSIIGGYRKHVGLDESSQHRSAQTTHNNREKHAGRTAPPHHAIDEIEQDEYESEGEDYGYEVERILAHRMSDPRTHPGKPPVMLYQVKWKGYHKPTWEPAASFQDRAILDNYQRKAGLSS